MSLNGYPQHHRNTVLFNTGIYLQKSEPEHWEKALITFNEKLFEQPLENKEVEVIIRSLRKKKYSYQCEQEPLCSFCNVKLCRTRKYGIGNISSLPVITSLTKVVGDESIWFMDVDGGRMILTTEELHDQRRFATRCMNDLNILPGHMKAETWTSWLRTQLDNAIEIKDDNLYEANELGSHLSTFIMGRLAEDLNGVAANRVWYDEQTHEVRFKPEAFMSFLKFRKVTLRKGIVHMYLRNRGLRFSTGKTEDRKSYRYACVNVTREEETLIQEKRRKGEQIL